VEVSNRIGSGTQTSFPAHNENLQPFYNNVLTLQGHIYGVQETVGTGLLYYRKSMLQRAGVQPPTPIDELIEAAKKLTDTNVMEDD